MSASWRFAATLMVTWGACLVPHMAVAQVGVSTLDAAPFRDCPDCPLVKMVPPGTILMQPQHVLLSDGQILPGTPVVPAKKVRLAQPFAVAVFPTRRGEYARFMKESRRVVPNGCYHWDVDHWIDDPHRSWADPGFRQTDDDPVVCVNYADAEAFIAWLNQKAQSSANPTDGPREVYRLPSREEQEYAAAGHTRSPFYWGRRSPRRYANFGATTCLPCAPAVAGPDRWLYTSPVGSFPPNAFGLFDTAGNVWEWSSYCEPDEPPYAECLWGAVHGGSWLDFAASMQRDSFSEFQRDNRNDTLGFRVVRSSEAGR